MSAPFSIDDTVNAWVPHGRFVIDPTSTGPLTSLTFAVKDVYDVAGHPTGAGNPTWLAATPTLRRWMRCACAPWLSLASLVWADCRK